MAEKLVIRNTSQGMVWQVYHVKSKLEAQMLARTASKNGFASVTVEPMSGFDDIDNETWPGWRETAGWIDYVSKITNGMYPDVHSINISGLTLE